MRGFSLAMRRFCDKQRRMMQTIRWSVFRRGDAVAVIPQTPLLVRLRQMTSDNFFGQEALRPLKSFMDFNFILGPTAVLASLYLGGVGSVLLGIGVVSLAVSSFYWFASHWLCQKWLMYQGFTEGAAIEAVDFDSARAIAE